MWGFWKQQKSWCVCVCVSGSSIRLSRPSSFLIIISSSSSATGKKETAWQRLRQHSVLESRFTFESKRDKRWSSVVTNDCSHLHTETRTQSTWRVSLLPLLSVSPPSVCLRPSVCVGPCDPLRLVIGHGSLRYSDTTCRIQDTSSGTVTPSASRIWWWIHVTTQKDSIKRWRSNQKKHFDVEHIQLSLHKM